MIAPVPSQTDKPRYDAALQARVTVEQLEELRQVADELGVALGVVIRAALKRGLEPARSAIQESIAEGERGAAVETI